MAITDIISEEIETRAPNMEIAQGSPDDFMTEDEMDPMQDPELQEILRQLGPDQSEVLMQLIKEFKAMVAQGFTGEFEDFVKMKMASAQGGSEEDFMTEEEMIIPDEELQSMVPMGEQAAQGGRIGKERGGIMDVIAEEQVETGPTPQQIIVKYLTDRGLPITPENIQRAIMEMSQEGQAPVMPREQMEIQQMEMPGPPTGSDYIREELIGQDMIDPVTPAVAVAQTFPHEKVEKEIDIYDYSDKEMEEIKQRFIESGGDPSVIDKITRGEVAQGGRIGYQYGNQVTADAPGVRSQVSPSRVNQIQGNQIAEDAYYKIMQKFMERFPGIDSTEMSIEDMIAMLQKEGVQEHSSGIMDLSAGMDMITPESVRGSLPGVTRGMGEPNYEEHQFDHPVDEMRYGNAYGGRPGYGLGSLVKSVFKGGKKLVKGLTKSIKKFAKSDLGKMALGYLATAGLGNILQPGAASWAKPFTKGAGITKGAGTGWLRPGTVFSNYSNLFSKAPAVTEASKAVTGVYPPGTSSTLPALYQKTNKAPTTLGSKLLGSFKDHPMPWILGTSGLAGLYTAKNPGDTNLDSVMANYKGEVADWDQMLADIRAGNISTPFSTDNITYPYSNYMNLAAEGGRIGRAEGGLMDLGGMEKDYRNEGGFVPIGKKEKADDVPARLSVNEFVFTADAVRNAGGGDVDKGAEVMENVMTNLEQGGSISEESQGLEGARDMFEVSERLSEVV